jgi:hypothetical protein
VTTTSEDLEAPADRRHRHRALAVQLVALAAAGAFLLWVNRQQWFLADEWNMLVERRLVGGDGKLGIWDAHNSHLAVLPTIVYRALFSLFGVRTYLPYLVVMIIMQLTAAWVLWRLLLRLGIAPTLATLSSLAFAIFGHGFEITTGAFGMQNAGALAFGFGALLAMRETPTIERRDGLVLALALGALLTSSGVAIPLTAVLVLVALVRRGWRPAALLLAVPAGTFVFWYVLHGEPATKAQGALGVSEALRRVPTFVAHGIWWTLQYLLDVDSGGPIVLLAAALLVAVTLRWRERAWQVASCIAVGAPLYLALTTFGRGGFGLGVAGNSRYSYVVIALLLPVLTLAVDRLARRFAIGPTVAVVALVALVGLQAVGLERKASRWAPIEQETKRRLVAAALVLRDGIRPVGAPVPEFEPGLDATEVEQLDRDGDLPGNVRPSAADLLTARLYLEVTTLEAEPLESAYPVQALVVGGAAVHPARIAGCVRTERLEPGDDVRLSFPAGGSVRVDADEPSYELVLALAQAGVRSRERPAFFPPTLELLVVDVAKAPTLLLGPRSVATTLRICGAEAGATPARE